MVGAGHLLEAVKCRGELKNTVIIYSSDHGDMLGDFDKFGKYKPERGSVHIPLVISGPDIQMDQYSEALVELQDLADLTMEEAEDSVSLKSVVRCEVTSNLRDVQVSAWTKDHSIPAHVGSLRTGSGS
ncbi:sulfatase-like hydrolase/transferase [Paenibacillus sp. TAF58]